MKITRIELSDFRAFAGPESFDLQNGKNLLVYGENGAGKSSLYVALREFFNLSSNAHVFADFQNIFNQPLRTDGYVRLHFDGGGVAANWPYGGQRPIADQRVARGALRIGCLDYRALLDTNYAFRDNAINLFDLLVSHVLAELPITIPGGFTRTVRQVWKRALDTLVPWKRYWTSAREQSAERAAAEFSIALSAALPVVEARANQLLQRFPDSGLAIELAFPGIRVDKGSRNFLQRLIELRVVLHGQPVQQPQHFLNEARLSAIALALYFAGLLETVPQGPSWPRVLVLDDVLIGLDMANRLPVLEIVRSEFSEWQVFLLTHDKTWYEMVRTLVEGAPWLAFEMYRHTDRTTGVDRPIVKSPAGYLQRAKMQLAANETEAAANYARKAFEHKLKKFCSNESLAVAFNLDPAKVDSENLLSAVERHIKSKGQWGALGPQFYQVRMFRKIVLNPLSHSQTAQITDAEVRGAIDAVEKLKFDPAKGRPALDAAADLCAAPDPDIDKQASACCLRATFEGSLRDFCKRSNVAVPWRESADLLKTRELWESAKVNGRLSDPVKAAFVAGVEAAAWLFLDELNLAAIDGHAPADFRGALAMLEEVVAIATTTGPRRTKLDLL
jgi:energy-coupling factor transporter ATP-binding protein EcfA2